MATVFKLYKSSIWVILKAKKDLSEFLVVTNKALLRAGLSTQSNAGMTTRQYLSTGNIAARPVARLRAKVGTLVVLALPLTWLSTRNTAFPTFLFALTVNTIVLTCLLTRRTF